MNSSEQPFRQIASNLLWTPQGLLRNPLVRLSADGIILGVECCPDPDRRAATSFYAGVLFPSALVEQLSLCCRQSPLPTAPLPQLLAAAAADHPELCTGLTGHTELCTGLTGHPCHLAVISGLDYTTLRLTPQSCIRHL